jgi:hypothetical protein
MAIVFAVAMPAAADLPVRKLEAMAHEGPAVALNPMKMIAYAGIARIGAAVRPPTTNAAPIRTQVAFARAVRVLPVEHQAERTQDSHDRNREPDVRIAEARGLLNEHRRRKRECIKADVDAE